MDVARRKTLTEEAYDAIRAQIFSRQLRPGTRLVVTTLARELQLSATPINEALAALDREGLVAYAPHRGYSVQTVPLDSAEEIYTVREALEVLGVRLAAERGTGKAIGDLKQIVEGSRKAVRQGDTATFGDLDILFHRTIAIASGYDLLTRIVDLIQGQLRLLMSTVVSAPGRFRGACEEHELIFEAIRTRDPDRAESLMRRHIANARQALRNASFAGGQMARWPAGARSARRHSR